MKPLHLLTIFILALIIDFDSFIPKPISRPNQPSSLVVHAGKIKDKAELLKYLAMLKVFKKNKKIRAHTDSHICTAFCTQKDQEKVEPRNGGLSRQAASQDA